jgi:hypothetical protein
MEGYIMNLYENKSSNPKWNAQANLEGRTHYVDDDTLRFHKARILSTAITDGGLLFALVESYAVDPDNRQRAFRPVIFDVFGNVVVRLKIEDGYKTSKQAITAMWDALNAISAIETTEKGVDRYLRDCAREVEYLRADIAKLIKEDKAA